GAIAGRNMETNENQKETVAGCESTGRKGASHKHEHFKKKEESKLKATATNPTVAVKPARTPTNELESFLKNLQGAAKRPMPSSIRPMLAISIDKAFDNPDWLFEIKWDGYRAVGFIEKGRDRLGSR